ncbi:DNA internalization-related competence protein ComEC/Rec2 [bacterium]|nr:DNA internalization-related competence protein ComEC/Rec2 [bacterium]
MNKQTVIIMFSCLYILGIIAFFSNYLLLYSLIVLTLLTIGLLKKKIKGIKYFLIFSAIFLIGIFNSAANIKYDDELTSFSDSDVEVAAKVISIPTNNIENRTKFYAQVNSLKSENIEKTDIKAKTLITVNDKTERLKSIKIGDILILKGRLKVPSQAQNPSQFDYYKYLQYKNTFSLIYVDDDWKIIDNTTDIKGRLIRKLNDTRNTILSIHAKNIKSPMLEILGGIIFGDDAVNPDEDTKASFINSGIFHILAASGMNVTLIFGIWFFFAKNLRLNYRFSIITGILLILFYTFMTGFGPPIIRASLMLILILIGKLLDKASSTISLLFIVAFLMLLYNPLMLFDIGFQLSFIVTFALILTSPLLVIKSKYKVLNYTIGACAIPVIAQLYAAPLQMFYFNTFTMYSVLANIAIIPVLSLVSFIGFISSIIAMITPVANQVCKTADFILNPFLIYIVNVAKFFANLPHSIIYVQKPLLIQVVFYFAIIVALTLIIKFKVQSKKILYSFLLILLIFIVSFVHIPNKNMEILFFSVGNADSIMIKSPDNEYFMIDTAKMGYLNGNSQAKNIMIKYMRDKGIKSINSLILSHFDADHAGGTIDILDNINVKTLYITDVYENTQLSDSIEKYIQDNNINCTTVKNEFTKEIYKNGEFAVSIIKPEGTEIKTENQKSILVHIRNKDKNYLFMGDGDIKSYDVIPDGYKNNITVMKSGHHGAKDTINKEMTENTDLFIISTGPNIYNHPNIETLNVITENNKLYLRTDYYNAIKIIQKDNKINIFAFSPKRRQFKIIKFL